MGTCFIIIIKFRLLSMMIKVFDGLGSIGSILVEADRSKGVTLLYLEWSVVVAVDSKKASTTRTTPLSW